MTEKLPHKIYNGCVGWRCRCDCGKDVVSITGNLRSGNTLSCGCHRDDNARANGAIYATTHGNSKHPLYQTWVTIMKRCGDPTHKGFRQYGGRGIRVCDQWAADFQCFARDMGGKPTPTHTVDRIDNNGDYSPENCRWATKREQNHNTRRTRWIEAFGQRKTLTQWAEECGVRACLLTQRIDRDGLSPEAAILKSQKIGVHY